VFKLNFVEFKFQISRKSIKFADYLIGEKPLNPVEWSQLLASKTIDNKTRWIYDLLGTNWKETEYIIERDMELNWIILKLSDKVIFRQFKSRFACEAFMEWQVLRRRYFRVGSSSLRWKKRTGIDYFTLHSEYFKLYG